MPLFLRQIARGGPVTVSDPRATRYFMTIREASSLVLAAAALGEGGEVFVLDMGEPLRIVDLARDLIALAGAGGGREIAVTMTGLRPGEKLTETLWDDDEDVRPTAHPRIRLLAAPVRLGGLVDAVEALAAEVDDLPPEVLAGRLGALVAAARRP